MFRLRTRFRLMARGFMGLITRGRRRTGGTARLAVLCHWSFSLARLRTPLAFVTTLTLARPASRLSYPTPVTPELMLSHRSASGQRPFNNSQTVSALERDDRRAPKIAARGFARLRRKPENYVIPAKSLTRFI